MANNILSKTPNYKLNIIPESQDEFTFKEWRTLLAGDGTDSNMVMLDSALLELKESVVDARKYAEVYSSDILNKYKKEIGTILSGDSTSGITVGGTVGTKIYFNDSTHTSSMTDGEFSTNSVNAIEFKCGDYVIKDTPFNGVVVAYTGGGVPE